ncbi:hypothetical protein JUNP543_1844 [Acinetobacter baumannii]|nr:hypothetical protein [Acinetobacter baumannii]KMV11372.1 hypothetical protein AB988_0700 [Acinetobacter baumannii]
MQINLNKSLKMNLSDFQKKLIWGVGILSIVCLWIAFPFIFKLLIEAYRFPDDFTNFGPFGDIYGSLNTLISSIALCAVAYSTWLQVTSLKETRKTNIKQLKLAEDSHNEQLNESRNAIFVSQFYSLLNYKKDKLNSIELNFKTDELIAKEEEIDPNAERAKPNKNIKLIKLNGLSVIQKLVEEFNDFSNYHPLELSKFSIPELLSNFYTVSEGKFDDPISPIISYLYIYKDLIELITRANISIEDKEHFKSILRNSMFQEEQILLFWVSPIFVNLRFFLKGSELFNQFGLSLGYKNYALQHHEKSHFHLKEWKDFYDNQKKPA